jgi:PKD repeat protein
MKKLYPIAIILCTQLCHGQNPLVKEWDYRFGGTDSEDLAAIHQTDDGGYILGGYSNSGISGDKSQASWGDYDFWVLKTDALGIMEWERRFGGTNGDYLFSLQQTADGGYILGGYSFSGIGGTKTEPSWGERDYWIVKIDSIGSVEWDKRFGGTQTDYFQSLQQTVDGGYILGGYTNSGITGDKTEPSWGGTFDYWVVKTDAGGVKEWDRRYGGISDDYLQSLYQAADGGYILGGYTESGIGGNKTEPSWGGYDYWIVKINSFGFAEWDKRFGGTEADRLYSLQQTIEGGYILGGHSRSDIGGDKTQDSQGGYDYWMVKIDSQGVKEWDNRFGGTDQEDDVGNISQTFDGGYLIAGTSYSNISGEKTEDNLGQEQIWVVKTDSLGNILWDKTAFTTGHDEIGYGIDAKDGCFVFANETKAGIGGYKTQDNWSSDEDYWIVKFCDTTAIPLPPDALISSNDSFVCQFACIDFFDQSNNSPTLWQWNFEGGIPDTSTLQNPMQICYDSIGAFDVTLITCNQVGCDTVTFLNFITAYSNPAPSIIASGNALTSTAASTYQWLFEGNIISGATNQSYTANQSGLYSVTVTDINGCTGFDSVEVELTQFESADTMICEKFCIDFFDASLKHSSCMVLGISGRTTSFFH